MAKMNDYPSVDNTDEFTQEQKAAFLGSAMCIATGSKTAGGSKVTANIPLSDITPAVPTKLSDLTDDITQQTVVANDTRPVSGAAVSSAMASFGGFQVTTIDPNTHRPVVSGTIDPKAIYLTPSGESGTENAYDEWICTDTSVPTWEKVGVTRVDLSQYYTKTEANAAFVSSTGYIAVPPTDNVNNGYLLTKTANGVQWNEMDREHLLRDGAGITVYGTAGYPERVSVKYDSNTLSVNGSNELNVKLPVPPISGITDGYVLTKTTTNNADDVVWAAGGGGDSLPERTNNDIGKILGIEPVYDRQYHIIGNKLVWTPGLPTDYSVLGSGATDYGGAAEIKATFPHGDVVYEFKNAVQTYEFGIWEGNNASYASSWDNQNTSTWTTTVNNNTYAVLGTINKDVIEDYEYTTPTRINITLRRTQITPPNALIEFANYTTNDIDVYIGHQTSPSEWSDGQVAMPMIDTGETYSNNSVHKAPSNSFISIQILGHGYTIKYRPLTAQEASEDIGYYLCGGDTAISPAMPTSFY